MMQKDIEPFPHFHISIFRNRLILNRQLWPYALSCRLLA
jgi:hypothetical protein